MNLHPTVQNVIAGFEATELHAARAGREVMQALAQTAANSSAADASALVEELRSTVDALLAVMPAYAPPLNVMHRMMAIADTAISEMQSLDTLQAKLKAEAESYRQWSQTARSLISSYGTNLIPDNGVVFTFTLSETMATTLASASQQGKKFSVLVTESRPNNDGLVTTRRMMDAGVRVTISIDACIGELAPQADLMMVGAEAIMADGSAICKVGTYPAALIAKTYGIPVYVVVDTMKFNITSRHGLPLWMDRIQSAEVLENGTPPGATVNGHLFDRTPADLVTGIVTECGILSPIACVSLFNQMPVSLTLQNKLHNWAYGKH